MLRNTEEARASWPALRTNDCVVHILESLFRLRNTEIKVKWDTMNPEH